jgi:hypothetical protein
MSPVTTSFIAASPQNLWQWCCGGVDGDENWGWDWDRERKDTGFAERSGAKQRGEAKD